MRPPPPVLRPPPQQLPPLPTGPPPGTTGHLQRRMADGECRVLKITDDLMPADFLTKWVPSREKLKRSVDHASNARARAVHWGN